MNTVGELRKALIKCPDETPLGVSTVNCIAGSHECGEFDIEIDNENGAVIYGR